MGTFHEEVTGFRQRGEPDLRTSSNSKTLARPAPCRVLIVDDEASVRQIIRLILEREQRFAVQAECACGEHALRALEQELPQLVLMDIRMPGMDGLECTHRIRQRFPEVPVVIVTGCGGAELLPRALSAGASGYLLKPFLPAEVVAAVDHALAGRFVLEAPAFARLRQGMGPVGAEDSPPVANREGRSKELSVRERQILELLARHYTQQAMARKLGLQPCSVDTYLRRLYTKLKVHCRADALIAAQAAGLLPRDNSHRKIT